MDSSRTSLTLALVFSMALAFPITTVCGQATSVEPSATPLLVRQLPRYRLFTTTPTSDERRIARRNGAAWSAVRSARKPFVIEAFPIQDDEVDLELEPFRVTGPNTRFVIGRKGLPDIPFDFDASSISLFRGRVIGRAGSHVYLALSEKRSSGYVDLGPGHQRLHIGSKDFEGRDLAPGDISVFESTVAAALPPGVPLCGVEGDFLGSQELLTHPIGEPPSVSSSGGTSTVKLKHMELAVDTDYEYFFLFGDETLAAEYLIEMYGAVSDIYMRDVNVWVELSFARLWTDPDDMFNGDNPLGELVNHWQNNEGAVHRDTVQLFSGRRDYPFGGQAYLSQLCRSFGYGVVGYASGFFPDPTKPSPYNFDVPVCAHELGHNSGTGHTHDLGIDTCNLANTSPKRGSIMSYCGQTWSGMNGNTDNYFHTVVRGFINSHVNSSSCIVPDCNMNSVADSIDISGGVSDDANFNGVPDECEDCNNNGTLDPTDIAGASLDQNFNGIPDECEPDCNGNGVPDDRDISLGTSTDLYGNGIPDECEEDCNNNSISDFTEIQADMSRDVDRNAVLDECQDCDNDGQTDHTELQNSHYLWVASGLDNSAIREFHPTTGVRTDSSFAIGAAAVREGQDVLIRSNGSVLVSSALDDRVMEFDQDGVYLGDFVATGSGGLDYPTGMLMTPNGTLLVASRNTHNVLAYNGTTGASMGMFVGSNSGGLVAPFGLTLAPDGKLFVTSNNNEVLQYNGTTGVFQGVFIDESDNGGLDQPRGMTFKPDGNLLVASFGTDEVLEYEWPSGKPLGKWAQVGTATRITQDSPWGIRIGPNGHVYVTRTGTDFSSGGPSDDVDHDSNTIFESHLTDARMFEYNVCTGLFRKTQIGGNDHGLLYTTGFDFMPGHVVDCNFNQIQDDCDIASGFSEDLDGGGVPDECEIDCNGNGTFDRLDLIPFGTSFDCNCNGIPDECDIADGISSDCNGDGRSDDCEPDCNANGEADGCDIAGGFSTDCDANGVPDDCESDCNNNTIVDACDLSSGASQDCNGNGELDECDTAGGGQLADVNFESGLPAGWTTSGIFSVTSACAVNPVCDGNTWAYAGSTSSCTYGNNQAGTLTSPAITLGPSASSLTFCSLVRTETGFDFCKVFVNGTEVFSEAGETGVWETEIIDLSPFANQTVTITFQLLSDTFVSGTLGWQVDNIEVLSGSADCNANTVPDECEPDEDCDGNGTRDICDIGAGTYADCNGNLVPDPCDISSGASVDDDGNGVPDECENCIISSPAVPATIGVELNNKNRFLSITAGDPGHMQAVRVTFGPLPPPYDVWNGAQLWASQPSSVSQVGASVAPVPGHPNFKASMLQCDGPVFMNLSELGEIHLFHEGIVPEGNYDIQVIDSLCEAICESCYSFGLSMTTARHGDTVRDCATIPCPPAEGAVNIIDVFQVLQRFASAAGSIWKPRADLEPECLDLLINITDVFRSVEAFNGLGYAFSPTANAACDSTCVSPLP